MIQNTSFFDVNPLKIKEITEKNTMTTENHVTWYRRWLMVSAWIIPLDIPSKIGTWVYIRMPANAEQKIKKARIYAGFQAFSAFIY
jgi:hypothetical protein